jgi:hypothetical protein
VWALIFLMLVLKIPILYLCGVVWWAIRAEPSPPEGAALPAVPPSDEPPRRGPRRPRFPRPHGGPVRGYRRVRERPPVPR